jgi:hypothetical protein
MNRLALAFGAGVDPPIAALLGGALMVRTKLRRLAAPPRPKKDDPDLARVRELVKGTTS